MCLGQELPKGKVLEDMVSSIDILPTLLELAGVPVPESVQGQSFAPLLKGGRYESRKHVFAEKTFHSYYDPMRAVRTERFKYIRNFEIGFAVEVPGDVEEGEIFRSHVELYHGAAHPVLELFDLEADPWEQKNLAGDAQYADEERSLQQTLWRWMEETDDPLLDGLVESPAYRRAISL